MPMLAFIPFFAFAILFLLALAGMGIYAMVQLRRRLADATPRRRALPAVPAGWRDGEDLLAYPRRLEGLERRLIGGLEEADGQALHLRDRRTDVLAKTDREELARRYHEDADLLERRAGRMRRVLGLVWRTRAVLSLRAHVAITARQRPDLAGLPEGDIPADRLPAAAELYESTAAAVRDFVIHVESRLADLACAEPSAPSQAEVESEDRAMVDAEMARCRQTYSDLQNRMDHLADNLSYLSDRCRTRAVVAGAELTLDDAPEGEGLVEEVHAALGALNDLAELGDRHLADAAMSNLEEDISQLERAGLEARAEAEAALEIQRLVEQFPQ